MKMKAEPLSMGAIASASAARTNRLQTRSPYHYGDESTVNRVNLPHGAAG
ncbi:MAG: hypothetical protein AAGB01_00980 [Cyanobacteria bacterium P01_F01_bin.42]